MSMEVASANDADNDERPGLLPRSYQREILEYVTRRNGIVFLPTGSGKTYIAIMAIKRFSHELENTIHNGGKRCIFMCNTVDLAIQQSVEIKKILNLKVGIYFGDRNVDFWTPAKWKEEIDENQVLVGTSQIFLDLVQKNFIKITDLSVVVIDECHHATKKHPMHEFLRLFQQIKDVTKHPRAIGLTGVLLKGNKLGDVETELKNLEATFRGNIVTVSTLEEYENVMVYSTKPIESVIRYSPLVHSQQLNYITIIKAEIDIMISKAEVWDIGTIPVQFSKGLGATREPSKLKYIKNLLMDFIYQMEAFGLYGASIAIMSVILDFEVKKRQAEILKLRDLYRLLLSRCEAIHHLLVKIMVKYMTDNLDDDDDDDADGNVKEDNKDKPVLNMMSIDDNDTYDIKNICRREQINYHTLEVISTFSTPKLLKLLMLLEKFKDKKMDDIRGLIFVDRRYTAKCLYNIIKKYLEAKPELNKTLVPAFMIGRSAIIQSIETIFERKCNNKAIEAFRNGECNLIVCSSVLEEGIDVQKCNFVVAFDTLKTFSSYIQTKGRARQKDASYIMFVPESDILSFADRIVKYQKVHTEIRNYLVGRILDRLDPDADQVAKQFDDQIKPFIVSSGACLLPSSALALLHRYCQTLPCDMFGTVFPWFIKDSSGTSVKLTLPLQSTVRETIVSETFSSVMMCKISAAFKACKRLYENGELNANLIPVTKRERVEEVSADFFKLWKKHKDDVRKKPGIKERRVYDHVSPDELYNALPVVGKECYAYEIKFYPHFEENDYNRHIRQLFSTESNFAILLNKKLPRLAEMPLFMEQGTLTVKISDEPIICKIRTEDGLNALIDHHKMIFHDLLNCWKNYFVVDKRNKENSFLIVPVTKQTIDWNIVKKFPKLSKVRSYSVEERKEKIHKPEDYLYKVITKWYSEYYQEHFVVMNILLNQTPLSEFDAKEQNITYKNHFESQYGSKIQCIVQNDQFLLDAKQLTSRRNFFINSKGKNANIMKKIKRSKVTLVPELCHNFEYPGDLWLEALLLPSTLHRLHYMLHAEKLRKSINLFLGVGMESDYKPKPLIVDESLARAVDCDGNAVDDQPQYQRCLDLLPTKENTYISDFCAWHEENTLWKKHLEPINITEHQMDVFPIEVDYYTRFIGGEIIKLNSRSMEEEYDESQLKMSEPKTPASVPSPFDNQVLAITDTSLDEKRRLNILTQTNNKNLCTAEQNEFVCALTTAGANDVFDMERFELLGDSFLKFSISLYLINKYPNWNEGILTAIKSKIVSNRNLLYCMMELDIPKWICSSLFKPNKEWLPPLVSLPVNVLEVLQTCDDDDEILMAALTPQILYEIELNEEQIKEGNLPSEQFDTFYIAFGKNKEIAKSGVNLNSANELGHFVYKESITDKVVADTLEAILGVCVKNYGIYHTFRMLKFFNICPNENEQKLENLLDLTLTSKMLRTNIKQSEVDGFLINYHQLEKNLGYKFKDRAYLLQALTHPSYPTNRITGCYQELEFIGDAILDFLVSCFIYEKFAHMTPGMLTDLRSALVNNITLACVCVRHRFHLYMLAENAPLAEAVKNFADFQKSEDYRVTNQVQILMEENDHDNGCQNKNQKKKYNISRNIEVPKALGDIVEAIIAAIYLDSRDLVVTWNVIYYLLQHEFNEFSTNVPIDPVRALYEHKHAFPQFSKSVADDGTIMVRCSFTCLDKHIEVNGFGQNSKQAKKSAAKHALHILAKHYN